MAKKKTWVEKLHCGKAPHIKKIDKAFAGIPVGSQMYISSPEEVNEFVKGIAKGQFMTPKDMRAHWPRQVAQSTPVLSLLASSCV